MQCGPPGLRACQLLAGSGGKTATGGRDSAVLVSCLTGTYCSSSHHITWAASIPRGEVAPGRQRRRSIWYTRDISMPTLVVMRCRQPPRSQRQESVRIKPLFSSTSRNPPTLLVPGNEATESGAYTIVNCLGGLNDSVQFEAVSATYSCMC